MNGTPAVYPATCRLGFQMRRAAPFPCHPGSGLRRSFCFLKYTHTQSLSPSLSVSQVWPLRAPGSESPLPGRGLFKPSRAFRAYADSGSFSPVSSPLPPVQPCFNKMLLTVPSIFTFSEDGLLWLQAAGWCSRLRLRPF